MPDAKRPNILLVTTDQQRFDAAGGAGPSFLRTPHFDDLRRQGLTFSSAYADCPICVPSRITLMTGQHAFTHGMLLNGGTSKVMGRENTLPTLMRQAGYQTAAIGKMHFTPQRCRHGFDEMILPEDYYTAMARSGQPVQPMHHGLGQNELYAGMATVPEAMTLTSWTAERCVDYIRDRRDPSVPFFLWCSFSKPHPPLDPPEPYYSMYRNSPIPEPAMSDWCGDDRAPEALKRHRQQWSLDQIPADVIRDARAAYYGLVTQIDYNMGRVFAALQDRGLFNDTLILYTSDHGEYLGDHRNGAKTFFHEPSAHVPFVLRLPRNWPDRQHGSTVRTPVTLADVLPTLITAAGGTVPDRVDGQDLVAMARGLGRPRRYVEGMGIEGSATYDQPSFMAITDGRWKYIWWPEGPAEQLFDLAADPMELTNLAAKGWHKDKCAELHAELVRRHRARASPWLQGDRLAARDPAGDTEQDRRNQSWPGYHTEFYDVDVRH